MSEKNKGLTMADLRTRVKNYRTFAAKEIASTEVFMSAVFDKDVVRRILDGTPDTHGVRIYLAKDSDTDVSDDVSYLLVPVTRERDGSFSDLIDDDNELVKTGVIATALCIGKFCNGSALD